jgi:hypothetical protein
MRIPRATMYPRRTCESGAYCNRAAASACCRAAARILPMLSLVSVLWCACAQAAAQATISASSQPVDHPANSAVPSDSQTSAPSISQTPNRGFAGPQQQSQSGTTAGDGNRLNRWVDAWLRNTDKARTLQPHFTAPIVTTHVMLVQQYRYDMSWQQNSPGPGTTANYGAGRGLEIIPTTRVEIGISPPNYLVHDTATKDGIGDLAWQVKYRAFSGTEGKGDYFVGFFMGGTLPTGASPNGTGHATLSPTFAAAKGLGPWDIQSTVGASLPVSGTSTLGRTIVFNTAVNYRIRGIVWPMLEQNSIFWSGGTLDGKKQTFITPGLILGSFRVKDRLRIAVGGGFQTAVTPYHQYNHRWILSVRFPF